VSPHSPDVLQQEPLVEFVQVYQPGAVAPQAPSGEVTVPGRGAASQKPALGLQDLYEQ